MDETLALLGSTNAPDRGQVGQVLPLFLKSLVLAKPVR